MSRTAQLYAGIALCALLLAAHFIFSLDMGGFIWGVALIAVIFAGMLVTSPADTSDKDTSNG